MYMLLYWISSQLQLQINLCYHLLASVGFPPDMLPMVLAVNQLVVTGVVVVSAILLALMTIVMTLVAEFPPVGY